MLFIQENPKTWCDLSRKILKLDVIYPREFCFNKNEACESQIPNHPRCNNVVPKTRTAILDKKSQTTHHEGMNSRGVRIHQEFLIWPVATIMV